MMLRAGIAAANSNLVKQPFADANWGRIMWLLDIQGLKKRDKIDVLLIM